LKKVSVTILAVLFAGFSFSVFGDMGVFVKAGLNFSSTDQNVSPLESKMRTGYNAGALLNYGINDMFSVVGGLALETRGMKIEGDIPIPFLGNVKSDVDLNLLYLYIPILAKFGFAAGAGELSISVGPEIGILLSAESVDNIANVTTDQKNQINGNDFGLGFHVGYEIPMDKNGVVIGLGYSLGLTDLYKNPSAGTDPGKNRNVNITVGYKIGL